MKFLQVGDLHLDSALSSFEIDAAIFIRQKVKEGLERLEQILFSGNYDGIILTGDIFDSKKLSAYWKSFFENFLLKCLEKDILVVYATGNHDYFVDRNYFSRISNYEKFVFFKAEKIERVEIEHRGKKLAFYGCSYSKAQPSINLEVEDFPKRKDEEISIAIIHGTLNETSSKYINSNSDTLLLLDYDYIALGHVHANKIIDSKIGYAGSLFSLGFDEEGEKGYIELDFTSGVCTPRFIVFSSYEIRNLKIELDSKDRERLVDDFSSKFYDLTKEDHANTIYKIKAITKGFTLEEEIDDMEMLSSVFDDKWKMHSFRVKYKPNENQETIKLPKEIETELENALSKLIDTIKNDDFKIDLQVSNDELLEILENKNQIKLISSMLRGVQCEN